MKLHFVLVLLLAVCAMDCESKLGGKSKKTKSNGKASKSAKAKKSVVIIATIETSNKILQIPVSDDLIINVLTDVGEAIGNVFQQNTRKLQSVTTTNGNFETTLEDNTCDILSCTLLTSSIIVLTLSVSFEDFANGKQSELSTELNIASNRTAEWDGSEVTSITNSGPIEPTMAPFETADPTFDPTYETADPTFDPTYNPTPTLLPVTPPTPLPVTPPTPPPVTPPMGGDDDGADDDDDDGNDDDDDGCDDGDCNVDPTSFPTSFFPGFPFDSGPN